MYNELLKINGSIKSIKRLIKYNRKHNIFPEFEWVLKGVIKELKKGRLNLLKLC